MFKIIQLQKLLVKFVQIVTQGQYWGNKRASKIKVET